MRTVTVTAQPLSAEAWAPFGWIPVDDTDPGDVTDLHFEWADPHLNYIAHAHGTPDAAASPAPPSS